MSERVLDIDAMLDALVGGVGRCSRRAVTSVPPRTAARVAERGLLGVMAGIRRPASRSRSSWSRFSRRTTGKASPRHQGLIALFDETNGTPLAVMDGTYITAIRTGGTAAVATRVLAREDVPGARDPWRGRCRAGRTSRPFPGSATSRRFASRRATPTSAHELAARSHTRAGRRFVRGGGAWGRRRRVLHRRARAHLATRVAEARRRTSAPSAARSDPSSTRRRWRRATFSSSGAARRPTRRPPARTSCRASTPNTVTEVGEVIAGTQARPPVRPTRSRSTSRRVTRSRTQRPLGSCTTAPVRRESGPGSLTLDLDQRVRGPR